MGRALGVHPRIMMWTGISEANFSIATCYFSLEIPVICEARKIVYVWDCFGRTKALLFLLVIGFSIQKTRFLPKNDLLCSLIYTSIFLIKKSLSSIYLTDLIQMILVIPTRNHPTTSGYNIHMIPI